MKNKRITKKMERAAMQPIADVAAGVFAPDGWRGFYRHVAKELGEAKTYRYGNAAALLNACTVIVQRYRFDEGPCTLEAVRAKFEKYEPLIGPTYPHLGGPGPLLTTFERLFAGYDQERSASARALSK